MIRSDKIKNEIMIHSIVIDFLCYVVHGIRVLFVFYLFKLNISIM